MARKPGQPEPQPEIETIDENVLAEMRRLLDEHFEALDARDQLAEVDPLADGQPRHQREDENRAVHAAAAEHGKTPDDYVLELFPGNLDRAWMLGEVYLSMRSFFRRQAQRHDLGHADRKAVLRQLQSAFDDPQTTPSRLAQESARLPAAAPKLWAERDLNERETVPAFIENVYASCLDHLERRHIATLDPALYKALSVFLTRNPDHPIAQRLPSSRDRTKELIDRLTAEYSPEELVRVGQAIDARLRRAGQK